jgi:hypothetical protein
LTQYTYPHETFEPGDAIDDHIIRCQNILRDYIYELIYESDNRMSKEEMTEIYKAKSKELFSEIDTISIEYFNKVKVNYISL